MPYIHITAEPDTDAPRVTEVIRDTWYPDLPPMLHGETVEGYTDRLLGCGGRETPFDHRRNRQCSIGFHNECTDPRGERCQCPCHMDGA